MDHHLKIYKMEYIDGHDIHVYEVDDVMQSACYVDYDKRYDLAFEYMERMVEVLDMKEDITSSLMIGAAGFAIPKYIISKNPNHIIDVIDINDEAFDIALEYFYLKELIDEYHLEETNQFNFYAMDGRDFIDQVKKQYDVIFQDAFNGMEPVMSLCTIEACRRYKALLKKDGILVMNVPGYKRISKCHFLHDIYATLSEEFNHVIVVPSQGKLTGNYLSNYILFASDQEIHHPEEKKMKLKNPILLFDRDIEALEESYVL